MIDNSAFKFTDTVTYVNLDFYGRLIVKWIWSPIIGMQKFDPFPLKITISNYGVARALACFLVFVLHNKSNANINMICNLCRKYVISIVYHKLLIEQFVSWRNE